MPTLTRLVLAIAGDDEQEHVFDTVSSSRHASPVDATRSALRSLAQPGVPPLLVDAMQTWLALPAAAQACADIELPKLSLRLRDARARVGNSSQNGCVLQEGTVSFGVAGKQLATPLQAVRALVSLEGVTLSLVALVATLGKFKYEGARPAFHFIGSPDAALVDVRALQLGKRSRGAVYPSTASHFLRRSRQLQAHAAAMQDVGVSVDVPSTRRTHTPLLDAYVSQVQHRDVLVQCVSVFV